MKNFKNLYKNMKITIIKQTFLQYLFVLLGFSLLCYYIWFRILRDRAPQIIPFETSWISFLIVLIICLTYIYIIIRIYKPKPPHPYVLKLLEVIRKLYYPIKVLNETFRTNYQVKKLVFIILFYFNIFVYKYQLFNYNNQKKFQILFFYGPTFILLFIFVVDIFYFHQIKIFYYFLFLSILPMIFDYLLYLIKIELENQIEYLDKSFYILILSTDEERHNGKYNYFMSPSRLEHINEFFDRYVVHAKYFIELQAIALNFNHDLLKYDCIETGEAREIYAEKHNIQLPPISVFEPRSDEISKDIFKQCHKLIPMTINVSAFFEEYMLVKQHAKTIKFSKIIIMLMYLVCWSNIFLVSFLNLEVLVNCLGSILDSTDPFSDLNLSEKLDKVIKEYENKHN